MKKISKKKLDFVLQKIKEYQKNNVDKVYYNDTDFNNSVRKYFTKQGYIKQKKT